MNPRFIGENLQRSLRIAADGIELSAEQIDKLNNLTPAAGTHHNEEQMRLPDR